MSVHYLQYTKYIQHLSKLMLKQLKRYGNKAQVA